MDEKMFIPYNGKSITKKGVNNLKLTLKACRINCGMTMKEAAQHFGIHYDTLSNYETDSTNVPRSFFIRLESVYGIPLENIYFGKQEDFTEAMKKNAKVVMPSN